MLSQDVSLKDIQEWLGHEDVTTTEKIYAHYNYKKKPRELLRKFYRKS
ncbi:hypothetical protein [Faecalicoccus pleomorphus]